jgi:hypothetical protein
VGNDRAPSDWPLVAIVVVWLAFLLGVVGLLMGCASTPPARIPVLPPLVDLTTLVQPAPAPLVVPPDVPRYRSVAVRRGQCPGLPPGILVSPAVYAEHKDGLDDRDRLVAEVVALERLRLAERAAAVELEAVCRARVADLAKEVQAAGTWTSLRGIVLFLSGVLIGGVTVYVSRPASR